MIKSVVFCPAAPVLIPEIAQGAADELDELRAACRRGITAADAPDRSWLVLAHGTPARLYEPGARGTFAGVGALLEVGLGSDTQRPAELPMPLSIGAWLLGDAGAGVDATAATVDGAGGIRGEWVADRDLALLVIGDGSARRGIKAPGYLDERAVAYDAGIGKALATGDPAALGALDPHLGEELLAAGVPVWRAVAASVAHQQWDARLLHTCAPYGVAYFAAVWTARG